MLEQIQSILTESCLDLIMNVLFGIIILIIGLVIAKWVIKLVSKSKVIQKAEPGFAKFTLNMLSFALKLFVIFTVAMIIGVPAASIVALIGSAGVAIGLALQGSLSNIAGGIMLVFFKPFKVGDYIDSGDGDSGRLRI